MKASRRLRHAVPGPFRFRAPFGSIESSCLGGTGLKDKCTTIAANFAQMQETLLQEGECGLYFVRFHICQLTYFPKKFAMRQLTGAEQCFCV